MPRAQLVLVRAMVSLLVLLMSASVLEAQARRGQGRARGGGGVVTPQGYRAPRPARPLVNQSFRIDQRIRPLRGPRRPGVGPAARYRSYRYRSGFSLGFGVHVGPVYGPYAYPYGLYAPGYPYSYQYTYPYTYRYRSPYAYATPPRSRPRYSTPVYGVPTAPRRGGVWLDLDFQNGAVYVDGFYVGDVDDFDDASRPIPLEPGAHRIEVDAAGVEPLSFDVDVQAGQTIRFRGIPPPAGR